MPSFLLGEPHPNPSSLEKGLKKIILYIQSPLLGEDLGEANRI